MPRSKTGNKRSPIDQNAIRNAINAITAQTDGSKPISIREASRLYKVSLGTLSRHLKAFKQSGNDKFEYSVKYDVHRVFTVEEEEKLVSYIINVANMNYGLTKKGVRQIAYKYALANNKIYPKSWDTREIAGEEWMRSFMNRHKDLALKTSEPTNLARAVCFNQNTVNQYFDHLVDIHKRFGSIPPDRIWTVNETGLGTVQNSPEVVVMKGERKVGVCTEHGNLVTMVCAVNALGNHIPPMLVFAQDNIIKVEPPGIIGGAIPSGCTNEALFVQLLTHFIAYTNPSKEERVLLILDNHETHISEEAVEMAADAGIIMLTIPTHTSEKLQQLDLTVFGPLKAFYNQAVEEWFHNNPGKDLDIYSVAEVLRTSYPNAFSTTNIISGFPIPGIYPMDREKFSESDLVAASVSDRPQEISRASRETVSQEANNVPFQVSSIAGPSNVTPSRLVTPEEVQPCPKAVQVVQGKKMGRKAEKTRIVTYMPEKEELRREKEQTALKKSNQMKNLQKGEKNVARKLIGQVSDEKYKVEKSMTDGENENQNEVFEEARDEMEQEDFKSLILSIEDYVLVQFKRKRTIEFYVGKICSKDSNYGEYKIKFLKRIRGTSKFYEDSNEQYDVSEEDIIMKLPPPVKTVGSVKVSGQLSFEVDFSSYNLK